MKKPSLILLVKFKSSLTLDEATEVVNRRIDEFRALRGLQQKYYLHVPDTQEYAGLYIWKSKEAFDAFRNSELRKTIASAYKTLGEPRIEVFDIIEVLRDNTILVN